MTWQVWSFCQYIDSSCYSNCASTYLDLLTVMALVGSTYHLLDCCLHTGMKATSITTWKSKQSKNTCWWLFVMHWFENAIHQISRYLLYPQTTHSFSHTMFLTSKVPQSSTSSSQVLKQLAIPIENSALSCPHLPGPKESTNEIHSHYKLSP